MLMVFATKVVVMKEHVVVVEYSNGLHEHI